MALRTGACWATHSILRSPSGARLGSLMMESGVISLLLRLRSDRTATLSLLSLRRVSLQADSTRCCHSPAPLAPFALPQHPRQLRGVVGHDPVGAEIQHAAHLLGVVYGPYVHPQAPVVGS